MKNKLLTGIGALAFMALLALNVQLVNTYSANEDGFASLAVVESAAQAQGEIGCDCEDWEYCAGGICYPDDNTNNGTIDVIQCDSTYAGLCGGPGGGCAGC